MRLPQLCKHLMVTTVVAALTLSAGCSTRMQEVADDVSWYHVRVPQQWQASVRPNTLLLHASKELPSSEDEAFERLSVIVLRSDAESQTPVAQEISALVEARASSRGWKDTQITKPQKIEVGGREGYAVDVSAADEKGREFKGKIALVRTNGREALIVGLAPAASWTRDSVAFSDLLDEWYWHAAEGKTLQKAVDTE
jgi:hypothetical protein